ncbi:LysR family transcriptional regulator [Rhodanobacter terrae]|uniref:LysR family transcriptional regulator n=1 Tax=Rhodanobacter terrae TaxID=418647 RepID=A0ABW0SSL2_9GAMM
MDLETLVDFNAVASHGGFSHASRVTGRPKATLSRRVRQLEDSLGVHLIERGARTLRLTEEGAALHEQTSSLLDRIDDIKEALMGDVGLPHGRLRINAPVLFAQRGLGRIAARYAAAYPNVQLEVTADDRFIDPLVDGYDLVIRANPSPTTELAGRCFLRDQLIVVAHPSIVRPESESEAAAVPAVTLVGAPESAAWNITADGRTQILHTHVVLRLSSMAMVHDAVLDGAGAAMMPRSLVQADVDAGRLLDWGNVAGRGIEVWALYPPHRHVSRKVSAFIRILTEQFVDGSPDGFRSLQRAASELGSGTVRRT